MSLGMPEILVLIVVLVVFYGIVGKRPGLSVWGMMLLAGGVFLAVTMLYFLCSVPHQAAPASIVMVHDGLGHSVFPPLAPPAPEIQAHPSSWMLLLVLGAAAAVIFFLRRASCSAAAAGGHLRWWPASLLLLLLPLFLFFGWVRVERSHHASYTSADSGVSYHNMEHASQIAAVHQEMAQQQADMHRQAIEAAGEVQRHIASMNIYELLNKFDAPRIPLAPPPAKAPHDESHAVSSGSAATALVSAQPSGSAVMVTAEAPVEIIAEAEADSGQAATATAVNEVESASDAAWTTATKSRRSVSTAPEGPPPSWVEQAPKRVGHVRREVIATDEYATTEECYLAADILLQVKTYEHIRWLTGSPQDADKYIRLDGTTLSPSELATHATGLFRQLQNAGITVDYIRREIAKDEHLQTVERSIGPMKKLYTLLEFSPSVDADLRQNWEASQRQARFAFVGFGASSVLGLLGLAWGLLKVDTMTKGYYTKRLFVGVPLGILGLFGLLVLFMETIAGH
jgi:hypothetical protein